MRVGRTPHPIFADNDLYTRSVPLTSQLWTDRYAPRTLKEICGNKGQVEKLQLWLHDWPSSLKSGFKKPNVQSPQKKVFAKAGPQPCRNCGKVHAGECRKGLSICYKCGKAGHVASQCTSELIVCFNCYKTGHKRSECPDLREERKGK